MSQFSENIKKIRLANNLTQDSFASYLGTNQKTYQAWESGRCEPTISKLCEMASTLGISVGMLIGEDEIKRGDQPKANMIFRKINRLPDNLRQAIFNLIENC